MKKLLMALLGIALVISMAGVASAGEIVWDSENTENQGSSGKVTVSLTLAQHYVVTIPDDIEIKYGETVELKNAVYVSGLVIPANQLFQIHVNSKNGWYVVDTSNNNNRLSYSMTVVEENVADIVCSPSTSAAGLPPIYETQMSVLNHPKLDLKFVLQGTVEKMGVYNDEITFTVKIVDKPTATTTT